MTYTYSGYKYKRAKESLTEEESEHVNELVKESAEKIVELDNEIKSKMLAMGEVIFEATEDLRKLSKTYYYKELSRAVGKPIGYLRQLKGFYKYYLEYKEMGLDKELTIREMWAGYSQAKHRKYWHKCNECGLRYTKGDFKELLSKLKICPKCLGKLAKGGKYCSMCGKPVKTQRLYFCPKCYKKYLAEFGKPTAEKGIQQDFVEVLEE